MEYYYYYKFIGLLYNKEARIVHAKWMYSYDLSVFKTLLLSQLIGGESYVNMIGQHSLVTSVKWM